MANSILATVEGSYKFEEFEAAATITPGQGVELASADTVQPVSTADAAVYRIAREQRNPPRNGTGSPVDQDYASGDHVETLTFRRGDEARIRLAAGTDLTTAANANVADGDELSWNSDGTLKAGGANPVAVAREANDNSAAATGVNPLIVVEFL